MTKTRARLYWIGAVLALAAAVVFVLRPRPVVVETAEVTRGPLRITVDEEGETRLKRRYMVSAPVAGRIGRIEARPGDRVVAGTTPLVTIASALPVPIDSRTAATLQARVETAEAAVNRAEAELARARVEESRAAADASRTRTLFETGYASKEEYELADTRLRAARETVRSAEYVRRGAESALAEAKAALLSGPGTDAGRPIVVTSPVNGVVLRRLQESAVVVPAGTPLIEVGDLHDIEIVADLLSTDAVKVQPGAAVAIERWGGDTELAGRVRRVEPSGFMKVSALGVEEQRVNVVIDLDQSDAAAALGDGYRVEVRIVVWEQRDVVKLPTSSLFRLDGRWAVFVRREERLERREVTIGQRTDREAEVLGGVSPGERVVVYPGESLQEGTRVVSK
jgi:HlyD family secretion protein